METKLFIKKAAVALVALAAMEPITMSAYDFKEGGIYYDVLNPSYDGDEGEVVVTFLAPETESYQGDVVIPKSVTHDGVKYVVVGIGKAAFDYCPNLTNVSIPGTVMFIRDFAFQRTTRLQSIVIPHSVIDLGRCAFWKSGIESAVIGDEVGIINDYCFQYCHNLKTVDLGSGVHHLNIKAFYDCESLTDITVRYAGYSHGDGVLYPPTMDAYYCFPDNAYLFATLHVPGYAMEAFKNDPNWGRFQSIVTTTKATSLVLDQSFVTMNGGEQLQLMATIEPADANGALNWTSSNGNVATVNSQGLVTAVGPGEAVITAATLDGTELTAQCVVRVHSMNVQGDNVLTVPAIIAAEAGMSYNLPVAIQNEAGISAIQCDIVLPEGITLVQNDGQFLVDVNSERLTTGHSVNIRQLSSGAVRVMITSMTAEPFIGNEGDLFTLHLDVAPEVEDGVYPVSLTNVVMADASALTYHAPDVATNVIVKNKIKGDANGDGLVNVGDYVTTANYIMELNPEPFVFAAADVDESETIDVGDLVGITNIIMGEFEPDVEPDPEGEVQMTGTCANSENACTMTIELSNDMALTAWQMDVAIPEGLSLQQAALTSRAAGHYLVVNGQENGRVKLLASSPMNAELQGNEGALLTLTFDNNNSGNGDVTFDNIVLAEPDMTTHRLDAFKVSAEGSGVREIKSDVRIYAQGDNIVVETPVETTVEIIMTNGMSRTVKAQAGVNTYPADRGIHIVRANGQVAKLKI